METRVTRNRTAQTKVEQEACQDFLLSSFSENNHDSDNSDRDYEECIGYTDMSSCNEILSGQLNVTETGDAGHMTDVQNQSPDENNNLEPLSPLKTPCSLKRVAEFDSENGALNNTPSPTKQSKLENEVSISNEARNELNELQDNKDEKPDGTEDIDVNVTEYDYNEQHDNEEKDPNSGDDEDRTDFANDEECDKEATAEEIVQKLCKNGKVLTLTEGEKYFKVIVYEDSDETKEDNDTVEQQNNGFDENNNCQQSLLQKIVDGDFDDEDTRSEQSESQHILTDRTNNLTNPPTGVTQTVTPTHLISAMPLTVAESTTQWYSNVCSPAGYTHTSQAAAIQSNFTQTMSQFAPAFLTTNLQDSQELNLPLSNSENTPQIIKPVGQATASQRLFCTPHPKNGQYMFYYTDAEGNQTQASFIPFSTSTPLGRPKQRGANRSKSVGSTSSVTLNSSGEENQSPPDQVPSPTPTPVDKKTRARVISRATLESDVEFMGEDGTIREQHNQKERRRRARIKEACDLMRQLVPGMSEKTDKATVFEFGARYIHFLKSFTGTEHDKDFLMKYSPY